MDGTAGQSILDQPVPNPRLSPEVPWLVRLRLQFLPDMRHVNAEVMRVLLGLRSPQFAKHLAVGDNLASVDDKKTKHGVFLRGQPDLDSGAPNNSRGQVHLDVAEGDYRRLVFPWPPPQDRTHAGREFGGSKGLRQVIIRARVESGNLVPLGCKNR